MTKLIDIIETHRQDLIRRLLSRSARHNDIWRQDILEKKGWNIVRIWSDEWFNASDGKEKLLDKIRQLEPGETA